jgi:hypothetical protein
VARQSRQRQDFRMTKRAFAARSQWSAQYSRPPDVIVGKGMP